ncbi:peptidase E [Olleya aquimaris]|nr:peptidase E [Olleya aquimaris]
MKPVKHLLIFSLFALFSFTAVHKYYVSITQIEYVKDKQSVQIITRIFVDDFEKLLRKRYDKTIVLNDGKDETLIDGYIKKYLLQKLEININNIPKTLAFIGKEYDDDIVYCYLEIENVKAINSFEVKNTVLFDVFPDQKNIVRNNINGKNKTFVLIPEKDKGLLNF